MNISFSLNCESEYECEVRVKKNMAEGDIRPRIVAGGTTSRLFFLSHATSQRICQHASAFRTDASAEPTCSFVVFPSDDEDDENSQVYLLLNEMKGTNS